MRPALTESKAEGSAQSLHPTRILAPATLQERPMRRRWQVEQRGREGRSVMARFLREGRA